MDKDRWAKIAIEMQEHIDALERIMQREQMDIAAVSLYGMPKNRYSTVSSVLYIDGNIHYSADMGADKELSIKADGDTYRAFECA